MAYRTNETAVGKLIELDPDIDVDPFIETANIMVTDCCAGKYGGGADEDTRLELIERWLSAHYYAIRDPRPTSEQAGSVQESYQSKVDLGLNVTHYGQQALRLDTKGGLATAEANAKKPQPPLAVAWLGTPNC